MMILITTSPRFFSSEEASFDIQKPLRGEMSEINPVAYDIGLRITLNSFLFQNLSATPQWQNKGFLIADNHLFNKRDFAKQI